MLWLFAIFFLPKPSKAFGPCTSFQVSATAESEGQSQQFEFTHLHNFVEKLVKTFQQNSFLRKSNSDHPSQTPCTPGEPVSWNISHQFLWASLVVSNLQSSVAAPYIHRSISNSGCSIRRCRNTLFPRKLSPLQCTAVRAGTKVPCLVPDTGRRHHRL